MRTRFLAALVLLCAACGDDDNQTPTPDAPVVTPDMAGARCGNGTTEMAAGEDCDDGNTETDTVCDATCHFTCGNGELNADVGEKCDTGITSGTGSCPASCDDGDACTSDALTGNDCVAECVNAAITDPADGDGCCPAGANANTDSDCSADCGNGILEDGELCDTGITAGAGACPLTCNDGQVCTTDTLVSGGTCQATCTATAITTPANGDGCCPAGANAGNDNDCLAVCGNGVREPSETCDTGIAAGMTDACPTTCSDGMACTTDTLGNAGTCQAVCLFPPITAPANNDGCCPPGANANNDNNCIPTCGNSVTESGEQCDDGNMNDNDACKNNCTNGVVPSAFRFSDLDLRDPHVWVSFVGCRDVTDTPLAGFSVNGSLQTAITTDADNPPDGELDLSPVLVFRPADQAGASTPVEIHFGASCTSPIATTSCKPGSTAGQLTVARNQTSGSCLMPGAGTTTGYTPPVGTPSAPCFVTDAVPTLTFDLGGIPITLRDARIGGTYVGASTITNGLVAGFITETDANATIIPASFPLVGGKPLSEILAGGTNSCKQTPSDKDVNGVPGWWFYLNFPATKVTWSDQ